MIAESWTPERERLWRATGRRPQVGIWELRHLNKFLYRIRFDPLYPMWLLFAFHGPRRGEVAALRLDDHLRERAELRIDENLTVIDGVDTIGATKSPSSRRRLELCEYVDRAYTRHVDQRLGEIVDCGITDDEAWMFVHADGSHVRPDWTTRRFAAIIAELDLPPIRLHDLRHLAASVMRAVGLDITYVKNNHGHSTEFVTLYYTHPLTGQTAPTTGKPSHPEAERHHRFLQQAAKTYFTAGAHTTQA